MGVQHGKDGVVKVGSTTIASVTSWKLNTKAATSDKSAMGDTWESHLIGLLSGDGSLVAEQTDEPVARRARVRDGLDGGKRLGADDEQRGFRVEVLER